MALKDYEIVAVDRTGINHVALGDAKLIGPVRLELNDAGSFRFSLPRTSPNLYEVEMLQREVQLWRKGKCIFWGVPLRSSKPEGQTKEYQCNGLVWYFDRRFFGKASRNNWLQNGSFDEGTLRGWIPLGVTANVVNQWGGDPSKFFQVNLDQQGEGLDTHLDQNVILPGGHYWTLSAWYHIRTDTQWHSPALDNRGLYVEIRTPDGNTIEEIKFDIIDDLTPRGVFRRSILQFHTPPNRDSFVNVRLYATLHRNPTPVAPRLPGGIIWDRVQLVQMESSSWPYADAAEIFTGIVSHAQDPAFGKSSLNITVASPPTGVYLDRTYQHVDHRNIGEAIREFPQLGILDYEMEFNSSGSTRTLRTYAPRKGNVRDDIKLELSSSGRPGAYVRRIIDVVEDGTEVATNVIMVGDGSGPEKEESGAIDTGGTDGLVLEVYEQAPEGTHHDLLPGMAIERLRQKRAVVEIPQLELDASILEAGIGLGDVLESYIDDGVTIIQEPLRLIALEIDPTKDSIVGVFNQEGTAPNPQEPPVLDQTPPIVTAVVPSDEAEGLAVNSTVTFTFSEQLDPSTVTTTNVQLRLGITPIGASVAYDPSSNEVLLTPSSLLDEDATYIPWVRGGSNGIKDVAGNELVSDFSTSFTTVGPPPPPPDVPEVVDTTPNSNQTAIPITQNVSVVFANALNAATVNTTTVKLTTGVSTDIPRSVSYNAGTKTITIDPTSSLAYETQYAVRVVGGASGVKDLQGDAMPQDYVFFFTTEVEVLPEPPPPVPVTKKVNFGTQTGSTVANYDLDYGQAYDAVRKYGWVDTASAPLSMVGQGRERNILTDKRLDTFMHMQVASGGAPTGKLDNLADDFSSQDSSKWNGYDGNPVVTGGQLRVTPTATYEVLSSVSTYDFTSSHVSAEIVQRPNQGNNTIEGQLRVMIDSNNGWLIIVSGSNLTLRERAAGVNTGTSVAWNATTMRFWRIRHASGTVFWETSPDATTWTVRHSKTPATTGSLTTVRASIVAGYFGTEPTPGTFIVDNVNGGMPAGGSVLEGRWLYHLVNGTYTVTIGVGDPQFTNSRHVVRINGTVAVDFTPTTTAPTLITSRTVTISNGALLLDPVGGTNTKICFVDVVPGTAPPPASELSRPAYAGSVLNAQDNFMVAGGYNLGNFGGPSGNSPWSMNTTHPPAGAFFGPHSSRMTVIDGYLRGYFDESSTPITVTCNQGHQHQVFRNGHYFSWNGPNGGARQRGGVWRWKAQYPTKSRGMGHVPLLWPITENWPEHGEFDCFENFSGPTSWATSQSFIHYGDGTNNNTTWNSGSFAVDMTQPHIYAFAWHPGTDSAGTGAYVAGFIDDVKVYGYKYSDTVNTNEGSKSGARMIPHGTNAVQMNLRVQTEAYGTSDADYTGGLKHFKFWWFQHWSHLTLAQMQAAGYF